MSIVLGEMVGLISFARVHQNFSLLSPLKGQQTFQWHHNCQASLQLLQCKIQSMSIIYFSLLIMRKDAGGNRKLYLIFIFICALYLKNRSSTTPTRVFYILAIPCVLCIVVFFVPASPQADIQFVQCPHNLQHTHRLIVELSSHCRRSP